MSNVGKSIVTAGILRVLHQDGYSVAPFKSQNMALNSFVTLDGKEMGRAQVVQAAAACKLPSADMNPILLKPMGNSISQVIVNGESIGNMKAAEYFSMKKSLIPEIKSAYDNLAQNADIIVIEGAGSPVEINLRENDIVNMGLAEILDAPVLLVGNIDLGGVFAQLLGTMNLLLPAERDRVKGFIINKFRGDVSLLTPGLTMFKQYCDVPFAGVLPYVSHQLDDEDSLSDKLYTRKKDTVLSENVVKIAVVKLPYLSNYSDFEVFEGLDSVDFFYTDNAEDLEDADLIILPGTKNTTKDMLWLKKKGFAETIKKCIAKRALLIGICGGFQMLGNEIVDELGAETKGNVEGLSLLPMTTYFAKEKVLKQVITVTDKMSGVWNKLSGIRVEGYEIHMGRSFENGQKVDKVTFSKGNVMGSYLHGIFDSEVFADRLLEVLFERKGLTKPKFKLKSAKTRQEDELNYIADVFRENLDFDFIKKTIFHN